MEPKFKFRSIIEAIPCPTHNKHPKFRRLKHGELHLICCFSEFKVQLYHIIKTLSAEKMQLIEIC